MKQSVWQLALVYPIQNSQKQFLTFQTPITHKRLKISIWNFVHQWSSHNRLIVTIFMTIDARFVILWDFLNNVYGSSNFRKILVIVIKLHTNIIYRLMTFRIKFRQNRLKRSNFLWFWIFWKFALNCLTCVNFELSSLNLVHECTNTE